LTQLLNKKVDKQPRAFRSAETEDKKVNKNGLCHLGQTAKNTQKVIHVNLTLVESFTNDMKERANLRSTQKRG
jgi:hypothetical protein